MDIKDIERLIGGRWTDRDTNTWFFEVAKDNEGYSILTTGSKTNKNYKISYVRSIDRNVIDTKQGEMFEIHLITENFLIIKDSNNNLYSFEKRQQR